MVVSAPLPDMHKGSVCEGPYSAPFSPSLSLSAKTLNQHTVSQQEEAALIRLLVHTLLTLLSLLNSAEHLFK